MFFRKVCALESLTASPKHPQSLTGLATQSQSETAVMKSMNTTMMRDTARRLMAKSSKMPRQNSKADSPTEAVRASQSGIRSSSSRAAK